MSLFIIAAEPSADLHGAKLIEELLSISPGLKIDAIAGPRMRKLPITTHLPMEDFQVMGFIDVLIALPRIVRQFFIVRRIILTLNPKAVLCIDYPGFNLRLERSLKKRNYQGKLIHYICPTVWAWGKRRIPQMAKTLDLLLTIFPFEKKYFSHFPLRVEYVGHPLVSQIRPKCRAETVAKLLDQQSPSKGKERILALFPGSREAEISRNFPLQLAAAIRLTALDPNLKIGVSVAHSRQEPLLRSLIQMTSVRFYSGHQNDELMQTARAAIATSGTVTLELALHEVPTVVTFAIRPIDLFLAQKIFRICLPFYCIVNIIPSKEIFPELFGPNFNAKNLDISIHKLWFNDVARIEIATACFALRHLLGEQNASHEAAKRVIAIAF